MKKKIVIPFLILLIAVSLFFINYSEKKNKYANVINALDVNSRILYNGGSISNTMFGYEELSVTEKEKEEYLEFYKEIVEEVKECILKNEFELVSKINTSEKIIGIEDENKGIYIYDNGYAFAFEGENHYAYKTDAFKDVQKVIEDKIVEYNSNDELNWYMVIQ